MRELNTFHLRPILSPPKSIYSTVYSISSKTDSWLLFDKPGQLILNNTY